ncbi:MAG: hypothetical protein P1P85_02485 [Patescibacteria group bacterium]|nr:hypothetical protein [Patescibacteria group bacterium]
MSADFRKSAPNKKEDLSRLEPSSFGGSRSEEGKEKIKKILSNRKKIFKGQNSSNNYNEEKFNTSNLTNEMSDVRGIGGHRKQEGLRDNVNNDSRLLTDVSNKKKMSYNTGDVGLAQREQDNKKYDNIRRNALRQSTIPERKRAKIDQIKEQAEKYPRGKRKHPYKEMVKNEAKKMAKKAATNAAKKVTAQALKQVVAQAVRMIIVELTAIIASAIVAFGWWLVVIIVVIIVVVMYFIGN